MANDNEKENVVGDNQNSFAGTNPARNVEPKQIDPENPVGAEEAQNVAYDGERLSGEEAEKARNKANVNRE